VAAWAATNSNHLSHCSSNNESLTILSAY